VTPHFPRRRLWTGLRRPDGTGHQRRLEGESRVVDWTRRPGRSSLPVDGRGTSIKGYESGHFVRPTILADVPRGSEIARTEIFGPVLSLMHVKLLTKPSNWSTADNMAIRRVCSRPRVPPRASFDMKPKLAMSESISVSPRRWRSSRSAAGRIRSSATCTDRAWMRSNSSRRKKLWSSAGPGNGRGSFRRNRWSSRPVALSERIETTGRLANHAGDSKLVIKSNQRKTIFESNLWSRYGNASPTQPPMYECKESMNYDAALSIFKSMA
jgi:hypothetical protein